MNLTSVFVFVAPLRAAPVFANSIQYSPAKVGFVKYRYRLHAETAKKELHDKPAFGGLCPSVQIGELFDPLHVLRGERN